MGEIESISAVTLATRDMGRAVRFYRALNFKIRYGGENASFTSFNVGPNYLNVMLDATFEQVRWGRIIFYVNDVDEYFSMLVSRGLNPTFPPRDADWGERYFHISDPDGHELSFAKLLG